MKIYRIKKLARYAFNFLPLLQDYLSFVYCLNLTKNIFPLNNVFIHVFQKIPFNYYPLSLVPQSLTLPDNISRPCGNTGKITSKHSRTALTLPGRLIIKVLRRTPATARESIDRLVFFKLSILMASASPGTSRSITARVASGVLSRGLKPVPPVVNIR